MPVLTTHREQARRWFAGRLGLAARDAMEAWLQTATAAGDRAEQVRALSHLGAVALDLGDWHEALQRFDQAYPLETELGRAEPLARLNFNRGVALAQGSQYPAALQELQQALALVTPEFSPQTVAAIRLNLGVYRSRTGDFAGGELDLEAAHDLYETMGQGEQRARALVNLGICRGEHGRLAEAEQLLRQAVALAGEGDVKVQGNAYTELGRFALIRGDAATAIHSGARALEILWSDTGLLDKEEIARICELFGGAARYSGDGALARRFLERAAIYYGQLSLWREYSHTQDTLLALIRAPMAGYTVSLPPEATLRLEYSVSVTSLLDSIESVYPALRRHGERLAHYSLLLGRQVGLGESEQRVLSHAGRLCDIGLTPLEEAAVAARGSDRYRLHPTMSEEWLAEFPLPGGVLPAVRHHHEQWDGSGYPDGLAGEEIPVTSRILRLCDTYLTQLHEGASHSTAMAELEAAAGASLDPALVTAFNVLHR